MLPLFVDTEEVMTETGTGKTTLLLVLLLVHLLDTQCANLYHGTEYDVLRLYGEYAYPEHRENDWAGMYRIGGW